MNIVPAIVTHQSAEQVRDSLLAAAPGLNRNAALMLMGLVWVESGRGALRNWNPGNLTAGKSWTGDAWRPQWFDDVSTPKLAELHALMLAGKAPRAFRAYPSAVAGYRDFVAELQAHFPSVWQAAQHGDAASFVRALHDSGYSVSYGVEHVATFSALATEFSALVSHLPAGAAAAAGVGAVLAFIGLGLWLSKRRQRRGY